MNTELSPKERRELRIKNRCEKGKHAPKENKFGVVWCMDCGKLLKG